MMEVIVVPQFGFVTNVLTVVINALLYSHSKLSMAPMLTNKQIMDMHHFLAYSNPGNLVSRI